MDKGTRDRVYFTGCVHSLASRNRGNEEGVMVMDSLNSGFDGF